MLLLFKKYIPEKKIFFFYKYFLMFHEYIYPLTIREKELPVIGERVLVSDTEPGTVRYVGEVHFKVNLVKVKRSFH